MYYQETKAYFLYILAKQLMAITWDNEDYEFCAGGKCRERESEIEC